MPRTTSADGTEIEYETLGEPDGEPMLLVMGLGGQLVRWPENFCADLVDRGYFVIRYDNRDVGFSTWFDDQEVDLLAVMTARSSGEPAEVPYLLTDMADDAVAVLDALGIERAHVLGVSMGGMIVQTLAIEHPDRLLSVTSIMSTTGDLDVGAPKAEALTHLMSPVPTDREGVMEREVASSRMWGSPDYIDPDRLRAMAALAYDRAFHPAGTTRHLAAVTASGSRSERLAEVTVPFLVIHGDVDGLIDVSGGRRTAEVVPGSRYLEIEGMGHDLVPELWGQIIEAVVQHTSAASAV